MLHGYERHMSATAARLPSDRLHPAADDDMQQRSDRITEAALLSRERAGTLTPSQQETLAEIRARRAALAGQSTPTPPAAPLQPAAIAAPPTTIPRTQPAPVANMAAGWRADFERSPELQREFRSVELFVTYQQGVKDGRIRIVRSGAVKLTPPTSA